MEWLSNLLKQPISLGIMDIIEQCVEYHWSVMIFYTPTSNLGSQRGWSYAPSKSKHLQSHPRAAPNKIQKTLRNSENERIK